MAPPPSSSSPTHFNLSPPTSTPLKLTTQEEIEPHLKPLILTSTTLTSLSLSGTSLGPAACAHLSTHFPSLPHLRSANLADIFTSRLLAEIPPALDSLLSGLLKCDRLEELDLSDNAFGLNTVAPLTSYLSRAVSLRVLRLQNNGLGPNAGAQLADALLKLAELKKAHTSTSGIAAPELEVIVCGRNRLESGSMGAWARMLEAHGEGLREVRMVQNGIRQEGIVKILEEGLGKCERLERVDLQDNTFTLSGAQSLAKVVGKWTHLKELGVGDSLLGRRGAVVLADALGKGGNGALEVLRLQYNEIDATGIAAIKRAVEGGLPRLRRVELNGNKFAEEDEGVEGLRLLLEKRKEEAGVEEEMEGDWGLDELSDLEEESDEEDEGDEGDEDDEEKEGEEEEEEAKRETVLRDADEEENQKVAEKKDKDVDDLADALGKTHVQ